MQKLSLYAIRSPGANYLAPSEDYAKKFYTQNKRYPTIADLTGYMVDKQKSFNSFDELRRQLDSGTNLYIQLNDGARKGSIARIVKQTDMESTSAYGGFKHNATMTIAWDDGKQWEFSVFRACEGGDWRAKKPESEYHDILVDYKGPTKYCFVKNKREPEIVPDIFDHRGNQIKIGGWIMDDVFRFGKVVRINAAGSVWANFVAQPLPGSNYMQVVRLNERVGRLDKIRCINVDESIDSTATLVDYDFSNFVFDIDVKMRACS